VAVHSDSAEPGLIIIIYYYAKAALKHKVHSKKEKTSNSVTKHVLITTGKNT